MSLSGNCNDRSSAHEMSRGPPAASLSIFSSGWLVVGISLLNVSVPAYVIILTSNQ